MTFNSGEALISAAAAGLGLIQVGEYYAQPRLESGELVEVLPDYKAHACDISVVFQQRK
jgi:LysR family transcriptional regulator for bpeEF and oprC